MALPVDLSSLASQAHGETKTRIRGGAAHQRASLSSMLQEQGGYLQAGADADSRRNANEAAQQALDHALARREAAMREAQQAASIRFAQQQRARARAQQAEDEKRALLGEYGLQRFQTDENIRQAEAIARIEAQYRQDEEPEDDGSFKVSDFGGAAISPLRGQALAREFPGQFGATEDARNDVIDLIDQYRDDPGQLEMALRTRFGKRTRTASRLLYDLGYGLQG